jgi:methionyl aminopeptidase
MRNALPSRRLDLDDFKGRLTKDGIRIHNPEDFAGMHAAGRIAADILDRVAPMVVPGATTGEIDTAIEKMVEDAGATSATIGYRGYEHASCISVNHVVCHGIPGNKVLKAGDILNIDVTVIFDGWFGDTSRMFVAGQIGRKAERLVQVTHDALFKGIEAVRPGATFGDIGTPSRASSRGTACRLCATSAATGWGRCSMRRPTCCTTGARAPVRCWRKACSSPSSRW